MTEYLIRNHRGQRQQTQHVSDPERSVNPEFYMQRKSPQE